VTTLLLAMSILSAVPDCVSQPQFLWSGDSFAGSKEQQVHMVGWGWSTGPDAFALRIYGGRFLFARRGKASFPTVTAAERGLEVFLPESQSGVLLNGNGGGKDCLVAKGVRSLASPIAKTDSFDARRGWSFEVRAPDGKSVELSF
jgi:hypothetical protein